MIENTYFEIIEGQSIAKLLEGYLVHRERPHLSNR
jgi:hypothetical protein